MAKNMTARNMAFDIKSSVRHKDKNGYLHVDISNITKEQIAPYYGDEIPKWQEYGLDPQKIYSLYRPAEELKKAAPTFNGIPLAFEHHEMNADHMPKEYIIGNLGTDAEFKAPYLVNSLVITDGEAIDAIERGEYKELSAAYLYTLVMEGGMHDGEHYDGYMTDIAGNHVALVREGRAGPDVAVADSKPKDRNAEDTASKQRRNYTPMSRGKKSKLNRTMAFDAVPAIENMEVNLASFMKAVQVVEAQRENLDPREIGLDVDKDITIPEIVDKFFPDADESVKSGVAAQLERLMAAPASTGAEDEEDHREAMDACGLDADDPLSAKSFAEGVKYGESLERNPEERKKLDSEHESEGMKRAMDACGVDAEDPASSRAFAEGVKYGEKIIRDPEERKKIDREHESDGARDDDDEFAEGVKYGEKLERDPAERKKLDSEHESEGMKRAMDAKIRRAKQDAMAEMKQHYRALHKAAQDCRPLIGQIADPFAFDSADDIYRKALTLAGVDTRGVHPSAFPAMLKMARSQSAHTSSQPVSTAFDSNTTDAGVKAAIDALNRIEVA